MAAFAADADALFVEQPETEAWFGRTLGKRLFGLVVVAEDGATASRRSILARNLLRPLDFLPCYGSGSSRCRFRSLLSGSATRWPTR